MGIDSRRVLRGVLASVVIAASPAIAHASLPSKTRITAPHRRSAASLRHTRLGGARRQAPGPERVSADDLNAQQLEQIDPAALRVPAPRSSSVPFERGVASWYGAGFNGHRAYCGERFHENAMTAAHGWLPMGTRVRVTLEGTRRFVDVTITDRPGTHARVIDLSKGAARSLGILHQGTAEVALSRL